MFYAFGSPPAFRTRHTVPQSSRYIPAQFPFPVFPNTPSSSLFRGYLPSSSAVGQLFPQSDDVLNSADVELLIARRFIELLDCPLEGVVFNPNVFAVYRHVNDVLRFHALTIHSIAACVNTHAKEVLLALEVDQRHRQHERIRCHRLNCAAGVRRRSANRAGPERTEDSDRAEFWHFNGALHW